MITSDSASYMWTIRPLTVAEVVELAEEYDELLAAMIDTAPSYPMAEADIRNSLFHMFVEWTDFSRKIIATAEPPESVLASVPPRGAAQVAIAILAETRSTMPEGCFDRLIADAVRDLSTYVSGARH